jgi:carboxyl-terminal processing protease
MKTTKKVGRISFILVLILALWVSPALSYSNHTLQIASNSRTAVLDGKTYTLTATPVLVQGRLLIPIRDISNLLGIQLTWDSTSKKATISYPYVPDVVAENQTLRENLQDSLSYMQLIDDPQTSALLDTIKTIKEQYLYPEKTASIAYAAAKGAVESLGDPYSAFYDPNEAQKVLEAVQGSFVGIGVYLQDSSSGVVIVKVVPNSPAEKAGLHPGDIIVKVNNQDVSTASVDAVSNLLKGEEGASVTITVLRSGKQLTFTVLRKLITVPTVSLNMNTTTVAVVQIDQFTETTPTELKQALSVVKAPKLILDLRGNPGGLVQSLVDIAGMFMGNKTVFIYRDNQQTATINADTTQIYSGKIYVLVDKHSASAAEMLAGALQDNKRATIVGERTYGKGVGQTLFDLNDGSLLYLTTFEFRTPTGKVINNYGIDPDIKVDPTTALQYVLSLP